MVADLRCPSRLHGRGVEPNLIEVKCDSKRCGAGGGTVVLHYFDAVTHDLVRTRKFQSPELLFSGKGK